MRWKPLQSLAPLAVLALVVFVLANRSDTPRDGADAQGANPEVIPWDPSRFLIKPYFYQDDQIAIALDGGEMPVPHGQVPSILIGANVLRTVHLSWVHDWSDESTRTSFKSLQALYTSDEGASLPALRIYLHPVFSDARGEAVQRAMLQVFFRADDRHLYQLLAGEIASGSLAAEPEAIRRRVESIEPLLMDDWNISLEWLESDIEKTFATARIQQARHEEILKPGMGPQLASMLEILPPAADLSEMISFVQRADTQQRTWLYSQAGQAREAE